MSQYTDMLSKQWSCAASSLPVFRPNIKMVSLALALCFLQRISVIGPKVFLAPYLHWIQCITLKSPYDYGQGTSILEVCKRSWLNWKQLWLSPRPMFSISKGPTETTHLPTIWWHRPKHICFEPELCQLSVQWPWWEHRERKPLAAGSVLYE